MDDSALKSALRESLSRAGCPFDEVVDLVLSRHADQIKTNDDGSFTGLDDAVGKYRSSHPGFFTRKTPSPSVDFRDESKKLGELEADYKASVADSKPGWENGVDFSDRSRTLEQLEREFIQRARTGAVK